MASADAEDGAGQLIVGGVVSLTVKVTSFDEVFPAPLLLLELSFASMWTVCDPAPTSVPAAGV